MKTTDPTPQEIKTLESSGWMLLSGIFAICLTVCFVFAKIERPFEYRPIVVTSVTRTLGTAYQPSTSRFVSVSLSVQISSSLTLTAGQSGTVTLQTSPDNVTYTTQATSTNNNTGTLTIGLNTTQVQSGVLICTVPAGYYYKLVTSGTSTFSYLQGTETQL